MTRRPQFDGGRFRTLSAWALVLACATWFGCTRKAPQPDAAQVDDKTIALVNGQPISVDDVAGRINEFSTRTRQTYAASPEMLKGQVEKLVEEELIISVAKKRGYDRDPRIQHMLRNQLVQMVREDVRKLVTLEQITEAEIQAYYDQNPDKFSTPLRLRARHILLSSEAAAQKLLQKLRTQGNSDKAFTRAAKRQSLDAQTREQGGDLGVATQPGGRVPPQVFRAMKRMTEVGELAGPVRSNLGWHLVRLSERHTPKRHPFKQVKLAAKMGAFRAKRQALYAKFIQELHGKGTVTRFYDRIDQLRAALGEPSPAPRTPPAP